MNIYEKLAKVQGELKAPKGQYNSFGKYKYRSAEDILSAAKPLCINNGLLLTLSDDVTEIGGRVYVKAIARITDLEKPEEQIINTAFAREAEKKTGMDESQITGTASSYARKYALNGLFAIDDTKDADTDEYHKQTTADAEPKCSQCGNKITASGKYSAWDIAQGSFNKYGRVLCVECGKAEKAKGDA